MSEGKVIALGNGWCFCRDKVDKFVLHGSTCPTVMFRRSTCRTAEGLTDPWTLMQETKKTQSFERVMLARGLFSTLATVEVPHFQDHFISRVFVASAC